MRSGELWNVPLGSLPGMEKLAVRQLGAFAIQCLLGALPIRSDQKSLREFRLEMVEERPRCGKPALRCNNAQRGRLEGSQ